MIALLFFTILSAENLTLDQYIHQVKQNHDGYGSAVLGSAGARLRSKDATIAYWPILSGFAQLSKDDRNDQLTLMDKQTRHTFNLGISEQTPFGLQAKFSYNLSYISFDPTLTSGRPSQSYYEGRPQLDISQPLWKNGFGSELRASIRASEAAAKSLSLIEGYREKVILSQAESAYWNLSVAKSFVSIQSDVLKRAQDLYDWAKSRVQLQLSDKSDRLQAEALLRLRELELKTAKYQEHSAARLFNEFRGRVSDEVLENLDSLDAAKLEIPKRSKMRDDVKAANEQKIAAKANAQIGKERWSPTVDLYGSFAWNGSDSGASDTISESFQTDQPYALGGIRVSVPLNFYQTRRARQGYQFEERAAQKAFDRKLLEQESQWEHLNQKFMEAQERFELTKILEKVQKDKLRTEKERLNRARTTTFQVIQFELDNAQAQIARLKSQAEILAILSEMRTFGEKL